MLYIYAIYVNVHTVFVAIHERKRRDLTNFESIGCFMVNNRFYLNKNGLTAFSYTIRSCAVCKDQGKTLLCSFDVENIVIRIGGCLNI